MMTQMNIETVKQCAKTALNMRLRWARDKKLLDTSRNQALFTYHAIMCQVEPDRDFDTSLSETKQIMQENT